MRHTRGLRLIGLSLVAAFAFVAFAAATAQAEDWLIETSAGVHELVTANKPISITKETNAVLHTTLGGASVLIECTAVAISEGQLETEGKGSGKLTYSSCTTSLNGAVSAICKPTEPITTVKIKAEVFNHNGEDYTLLSPGTGTTFFKFKFPNEECILNPEKEVTGTIVVKDCEGKGMVFLTRHLIEEAGATLFASGAHINSVKIGANAASILGSIWIELAAPQAGKPFKAMLTGVL